MAKKEEKVDNGAEVAEVAQAPSLRKYQEKMKARYADEYDPASNEPDMLDRYAEEVEGDLTKYKEAEESLNETMRADPVFAQFVYDVAVNKLPMRAAIAKYFAAEDLIPQEGDDDFEAHQAAYKERVDKSNKMSALEKEIAANEEASFANIDAFAQEQGYSEEQKTALIDKINSVLQDAIEKKISPELLMSFHKMLSFDSEVEAAKEAGKIEGKNEKIESIKAKEEEEIVGDGVPVTGTGTEAAVAMRARKQDPFFGGIKKRNSI